MRSSYIVRKKEKMLAVLLSLIFILFRKIINNNVSLFCFEKKNVIKYFSTEIFFLLKKCFTYLVRGLKRE